MTQCDRCSDLQSAWRKTAVFSALAELPKQQTTPPYSCSICTISRVANHHNDTHTHTHTQTHTIRCRYYHWVMQRNHTTEHWQSTRCQTFHKVEKRIRWVKVLHPTRHTMLVAQSHSGRTPVFSYSWRVTTYVGKTSAICQPTRPTQPFILLGSINWVLLNFIGCVLVAPSGECSRGWAGAVISCYAPCVAALWPA